jgi:hypothetical protein
MEAAGSDLPSQEVSRLLNILRPRLARYDFFEIALCSRSGSALPRELTADCLDLDAAATAADLLLNVAYDVPGSVVSRFKRTALLDIDPGLLQVWMSQQLIDVPGHDAYFSIGETVGRPNARFSSAGIDWNYVPPCVDLTCWSPSCAPAHAPFTTVSNWWTADEWMEDEEGVYANDKRDGFLPYLELPRRADLPLELALCLGPDDDDERRALERLGWRVVDAESVAGTPENYQRYIQQSRGEFSCVKPSCIRLQNAWISDRTICYLASGKPAIIQHTGPSRFLPDEGGLLRFQTLDEAARCLAAAFSDYERHSRLARQLAEQYFDARRAARLVLERALT